MPTNLPFGPKRASAEAVLPAHAAAPGATAAPHGSSRCDNRLNPAGRDGHGRQPRRGQAPFPSREEDPFWLTCLGIVLVLVGCWIAFVVLP